MENNIDYVAKGEKTRIELLSDFCDSYLKKVEELKSEANGKSKSQLSGKKLGTYEGKDIILKNGRYGKYFAYNEKNYSLKINKKFDDIVLNDAINVLNQKYPMALENKINGENIIIKEKNNNYFTYLQRYIYSIK